MRITPVTVAETDALGDKIAPVLAAAIGRTLRTVTRRWRTMGKASVDDLAAIAPAWARQVEHELMPAIAEAYWQGVNGLLDPLTEALTAAAPPTSLPDPWQNPVVVQGAALKAKSIHIATVTNQQALDYLAEANNRLVNVSNLIWETARGELLDGMAAGEGIEKLAARVARVSPQLAQPRAEVIARTEVVGASNAGSFAQAQLVGPDGRKTWLNAGDSRVRDSHRRVSPSTVGMSETFHVGGADMQRPHDPAGPAREVIQCRCVLTYDIAPDGVPTTPVGKDPFRAISYESRYSDIPTPGDAIRYKEPELPSQYGYTLGDLRKTLGIGKGDLRRETLMKFNDVVGRRFGERFSAVEKLTADLTADWDHYYAWCRTTLDGRTVLGINPELLWSKRVEADELSGFHPPGSRSIWDILVHEHGHMMMMTPRGLPYYKIPGEARRAAVAAYNRARAQSAQALVDAGGPQKMTDLAKAVSGYAGKNADECAAEMWAWYHMGAAAAKDTRPTWLIRWGETFLRQLGLDPTPLCKDLGLC